MENIINDQAKFLKEKPEEVLAKVARMIESKEVKQSTVAKYIEHSNSVVSQYFAGQYKGDVAKIEDGIFRFYRHWMASRLFRENSLTREIDMYLNMMWNRKIIGKITAPWGFGKTSALKNFSAKNEFATYLELDSAETPNSIIQAIAERLGRSSIMAGSKKDRLDALKRELQRQSRLLIIDEADNLSVKTIAILKDIHGGREAQRCSVVLVGTEKLNQLLKASELGYLNSRVEIYENITDHISFREAKDIASLFIHNLDDDDLENAWTWAKGNYSIRSFTALLFAAYDVHQMIRSKTIDSRCLAKAYEIVTGERKKK